VKRPIARHGLSRRKTLPNSSVADVDRRRRPVVDLAVDADEPGVDRDDEDEDADRAEQHLDDERDPEQRALPPALEVGAGPAGGQAQERDDEHGGRRHGEQPHRDRQVRPTHDRVSEDHHGLGV
jgi:hypothetical protein